MLLRVLFAIFWRNRSFQELSAPLRVGLMLNMYSTVMSKLLVTEPSRGNKMNQFERFFLALLQSCYRSVSFAKKTYVSRFHFWQLIPVRLFSIVCP